MAGMKFPWIRLIVTVVVSVVLVSIMMVGLSLQTQYQGIIAAQQLNVDDPLVNALAFWIRRADIASVVLVTIWAMLLCVIWVPDLRARFGK